MWDSARKVKNCCCKRLSPRANQQVIVPKKSETRGCPKLLSSRRYRYCGSSVFDRNLETLPAVIACDRKYENSDNEWRPAIESVVS